MKGESGDFGLHFRILIGFEYMIRKYRGNDFGSGMRSAHRIAARLKARGKGRAFLFEYHIGRGKP